MKYPIYFSFLIITLLFSCKGNQKVNKNKSANEVETYVKMNVPEQIDVTQQLKFEVVATADNGIILYDPMLVRIERLEEGKWKSLRILHCPCGANCKPPPREKKLNKNESWTYSWNLIESWCENQDNKEIPKTIELKAIPGKYRALIFYGNNSTERIQLTKEFQIVN